MYKTVKYEHNSFDRGKKLFGYPITLCFKNEAFSFHIRFRQTFITLKQTSSRSLNYMSSTKCRNLKTANKQVHSNTINVKNIYLFQTPGASTGTDHRGLNKTGKHLEIRDRKMF